MAARLVLALALAAAAQPSGSAPAKKATPLFAGDQPIHVAIRGPISAIARTPESLRTAQPATLTLISPASETHAIQLSPRGLTRRLKITCTFPPLRVEFTSKPVASSLFKGQKRLKLTTHCRSSPQHQQYVLLEYASYRLFNVLSPHGLRARLARVDYSEQDGRAVTSRLGFFVEDGDDAAKRNGLVEARMPPRISPSQLDAVAAARAALFEYMIGNLDWSMRAGPQGDACCHNFRLMATSASSQTGLVPVPYDFDYSGFVNAPYAQPPEGISIGSVRERRYHHYCIHNPQVIQVAAEFRAKRGELLAMLASIPQLDDSRRRSASAYLEAFFRDIATDQDVTKRVLRDCVK
jgi:hypothetical protein